MFSLLGSFAFLVGWNLTKAEYLEKILKSQLNGLGSVLWISFLMFIFFLYEYSWYFVHGPQIRFLQDSSHIYFKCFLKMEAFRFGTSWFLKLLMNLSFCHYIHRTVKLAVFCLLWWVPCILLVLSLNLILRYTFKSCLRLHIHRLLSAWFGSLGKRGKGVCIYIKCVYWQYICSVTMVAFFSSEVPSVKPLVIDFVILIFFRFMLISSHQRAPSLLYTLVNDFHSFSSLLKI